VPLPAAQAPVVRFGAFECDPEAGELRKSGMKVRLPEQPLKVLLALLEQPGSVVSREELRQRLWPGDTFVDFDHGLNAAVKRLRAALGDAADSPRFVETVPLRGYRFVAPVAGSARASPRVPLGPVGLLILGLLMTGVAATLAFRAKASFRAPELAGSARITYSGRVGLKSHTYAPAPFFTDGVRIYFTEMDAGGRMSVAQVPAAGGEAVPIPSPLERPLLLALAPDGSRLLVRDTGLVESEGPLFVLPTSGGGARRLGEVIAQDGAWSPDGQRLAYSRGRDLYAAAADGARPALLTTLPGQAVWPRWSPDGRRLRLTVVDPHNYSRALWEVAADGSAARPLLGGEGRHLNACCGEWAADGALFVFPAFDGERRDLWGLREDGFGRGGDAPVRLTRHLPGLGAAVPSPDGRRLFVARTDSREEMFRYDLLTRRLVAHRGLAGERSRNLEWVAWVDRMSQGGLWRGRPDGRDRLQIAPSGMDFLMGPSWSPDGTRIAFAGRERGQPWKIHVVGADGRSLRKVLPGDRNEADPSWSPDGRSLMFGRPPDYLAEPGSQKAIHLVDLETNAVSTLPGSEGLFSPRWSPEGSRVAAMPLDQRGLMLFDFATEKWVKVAPNTVHNPLWSPDGRSIYFQEVNEAYRPIYRVTLPEARVERVVSGAELVRDCFLVALDDAPYLSCQSGGTDLYALEWTRD
jgi:Tol biopolymer transport system component/DNA-binding winged helix-turn-helix (wHTH) protein